MSDELISDKRVQNNPVTNNYQTIILLAHYSNVG